ncbi:hypothetical protein ES705_29136 [subsurface metagenome]
MEAHTSFGESRIRIMATRGNMVGGETTPKVTEFSKREAIAYLASELTPVVSQKRKL